MSLDPQTMARFFCNICFFFLSSGQKYLTESTYREKSEFWLMVSVTSVCVASSAASGYAEEGSRGRGGIWGRGCYTHQGNQEAGREEGTMDKTFSLEAHLPWPVPLSRTLQVWTHQSINLLIKSALMTQSLLKMSPPNLTALRSKCSIGKCSNGHFILTMMPT